MACGGSKITSTHPLKEITPLAGCGAEPVLGASRLKHMLTASLARKPGVLLLWVPTAKLPGFPHGLHVREAY